MELVTLIEERRNKIRRVLFESVCILGESGTCDRTREGELFVDHGNIQDFLTTAMQEAYEAGQRDGKKNRVPRSNAQDNAWADLGNTLRNGV